MKITSIKWMQFATDPKDKVFGMCTIVVEGILVINEIRVINGHSRVYVTYPNRAYNVRNKSGAVYPIDDELRSQWEDEILADFERAYTEFFQQ